MHHGDNNSVVSQANEDEPKICSRFRETMTEVNYIRKASARTASSTQHCSCGDRSGHTHPPPLLLPARISNPHETNEQDSASSDIRMFALTKIFSLNETENQTFDACFHATVCPPPGYSFFSTSAARPKCQRRLEAPARKMKETIRQ